MRLRAVLCLMFLLQSCGEKPSQDSVLLITYFNHIKQLDFKKSYQAADQIEDGALASEMKQLSQLLEEGVQGKRDVIGIEPVETASRDIMQVFILLNRGYSELFFNPDKLLAYRNFYDALDLARVLEIPELQKFCLRSILEYYRAEIARNDKNYRVYLQELQNLRSDPIDQIWEVLYKLIFKTAYLKELDEDYFDLIADLKSLEKKLEADHPLRSQIYFEEALSHELKGNWEEAKGLYESALAHSRPFKHQSYIGFSSIIKLAEYFHQKGNIDSAFTQLKEIECCLNPNDTLRDRYYLSHYKSKYLKEIESCCPAYDELLKSTDAGFLLDFRTNNLEIARLQVELDTQGKELENKKLESQLTGLISVIGIGVLFTFFVIHQSRKKRQLAEKDALLRNQEINALLKEQELVSIDAMIAGQEKERQRIANDLHDNLGSSLATLKLHLQNLKANERTKTNNTERFEKTEQLLEETYQKVRSMAHAKNAGLKGNEGLVPAVQKFAAKISLDKMLSIEVEDHGMEQRLENAMEIMLFRTIQEMVTNVVKHARATECTIHITHHENNINILVEDNGVGFKSHELAGTEGMGLYSIQKRIEALDGTLNIESVPGKGTSIIVDIPLI